VLPQIGSIEQRRRERKWERNKSKNAEKKIFGKKNL